MHLLYYVVVFILTAYIRTCIVDARQDFFFFVTVPSIELKIRTFNKNKTLHNIKSNNKWISLLSLTDCRGISMALHFC